MAIAAASAAAREALLAALAEAGVTVVHVSDRVDDVESVLEGADADVALFALDAADELALPPSFEITGDLAQRVPAVILLIDHPGAGWVATALAAGVFAVLPRQVNSDELRAAVQSAELGLITLSQDQVASLTANDRNAARLQLRRDAEPPRLTPREREILGMLADGLANKEIAARLHISSHTVKTYVESLLSKLGTDSRAGAVAAGARRGLILL
ncbi:MAG: LuxR C-terminal-related transcriptional regulator [Gemmatimonadaceae bacterium]